MRDKLKGLGFFVFSCACFYYSYYWYAYHTPRQWMDLVRQYSFFTNQTIFLLSIYTLGVSLYYLGGRRLGKYLFNSYVKTAMTSYVFAVSLGYYIGVAKFYLTSWSSMYVGESQSIFMHFIAPVVVGLTYHSTPFIGKIEAKGIVTLAIYPLFYLYYATLYSRFTGEYIYPILDPGIMGDHLQIPLFIVFAFVGFWFITILVGEQHNLCINRESGDIS